MEKVFLDEHRGEFSLHSKNFCHKPVEKKKRKKKSPRQTIFKKKHPAATVQKKE